MGPAALSQHDVLGSCRQTELAVAGGVGPACACSLLCTAHMRLHDCSSLCACRFLCGSIEAFSEHTGLSQAFLGIIVLPIAGNACEHITAVVVAMKNKMDLALGVAVGSSIQIAIFAM